MAEALLSSQVAGASWRWPGSVAWSVHRVPFAMGTPAPGITEVVLHSKGQRSTLGVQISRSGAQRRPTSQRVSAWSTSQLAPCPTTAGAAKLSSAPDSGSELRLATSSRRISTSKIRRCCASSQISGLRACGSKVVAVAWKSPPSPRSITAGMRALVIPAPWPRSRGSPVSPISRSRSAPVSRSTSSPATMRATLLASGL